MLNRNPVTLEQKLNNDIQPIDAVSRPTICQTSVGRSFNRQITEKELKIAAQQINLQRGLIEHLIQKVRENQKLSSK